MACQPILIVEDEPDLRETLKELLEIQGFQVAAAANGREGLEQLSRIGVPCLILLDLMMPVMNGWDFLEELKARHQHILASIPITVTSAAADAVEVGKQYGCRIMKKPVVIRDLLAHAHENCRGGRP